MDWNPVTKPYCKECPYYESEGNYIYLLERDEKMRMCKHLRICHRIYKMSNESKQRQLSDFITS